MSESKAAEGTLIGGSCSGEGKDDYEEVREQVCIPFHFCQKIGFFIYFTKILYLYLLPPYCTLSQYPQFSFLFNKDRYLPVANIARIMKNVLPENAKVAKEAKDVIQECVSEFVSFITSEASDKCIQEKRKTINGDDLLYAMSTLGFDKYVEPLKLYLQKYREATRSGGGATNVESHHKQKNSFATTTNVTLDPLPNTSIDSQLMEDEDQTNEDMMEE